MRNPIPIFISIMIFSLFGCSQSKEEKAFKVYNEGVTFSLDAGILMEEGNEGKAKDKYLMAIDKFKKTIEIDPSHKGAASSLGFGFYEIKKYGEAVHWFEKAIKTEPEFAVNYQFSGLSQINNGNIEEGENNIKKAFEVDGSEEMKSNTSDNLIHIGNLAYSYGEAYGEEGKAEKALDYKKFGVRILMSALEFSDNDIRIGKMIEGYALQMNDDMLLKWIKEKLK